MEVHRQLGPGFLEAIYQNALELEFALRGIGFQPQHPLTVAYKGHSLGTYRADFVCFEPVLVEIKAITELTRTDYAQIIHYMRATGITTGLLMNFGSPSLQYQRLTTQQDRPTQSPKSA